MRKAWRMLGVAVAVVATATAAGAAAKNREDKAPRPLETLDEDLESKLVYIGEEVLALREVLEKGPRGAARRRLSSVVADLESLMDELAVVVRRTTFQDSEDGRIVRESLLELRAVLARVKKARSLDSLDLRDPATRTAPVVVTLAKLARDLSDRVLYVRETAKAR